MLQGRVDDNITTMRKRLKIFEALNRPVIEYYKNKGKLYTVSSFLTSSPFHLRQVGEAVDNVLIQMSYSIYSSLCAD